MEDLIPILQSAISSIDNSQTTKTTQFNTLKLGWYAIYGLAVLSQCCYNNNTNFNVLNLTFKQQQAASFLKPRMV